MFQTKLKSSISRAANLGSGNTLPLIVQRSKHHNFDPFRSVYWYGNPKKGIASQSNRVLPNGGLSPLRWSRMTISEPATLNLASAGQKSTNGTASFLNSLPPKNWMFARNATTQARRRLAALPEILGAAEANETAMNSFLYRNQLKNAKRIVIKLGSAVITREDGQGLALGRLASIVEQVAELQNSGRECMIITSGAVAFGRQKLLQELMMSMSMRDTLHNESAKDDIKALIQSALKKPNAAVGQSGLQALYETMFRNYGILVGQVLVTKPDFYNDETRHQLFTTINELLQLNIIPIINTNDAVSPPPQKDDEGAGSTLLNITDNDSLAARIAVEIGADLAILMSDVDGIYDKPPNQEGSRVLHTFVPQDLEKVTFGTKSNVGTGGMESKVKSAMWALDHGSSVVICNGMKYNTIRKIIDGEKIGTFFSQAANDAKPVDVMAKNARNGSRRLQGLEAKDRADVISRIASSLISRQSEILAVNEVDVAAAKKAGTSPALLSRLALTQGKLQSLANGLNQIAESSHNIVGRVVRHTKVSETLDLVQKTVPIGVLMVIFESRPDALPQVAALAIASANGLLLKGGKEASNTNKLLMSIVTDALGHHGCSDAISMISTREAIGDLLKLDEYIDLVIPRGSSDLVRSIKEQSKMIPVLGHAEGVCHVYLDKSADPIKSLKIVKDSKTDYPAACNAMETLLVHEDLLKSQLFDEICNMLKEKEVKIFSGPQLSEKLTFGPAPAVKLRHEYGDLACTIEIVKDVDDAINHIHKYGSSHTDVIVAEDEEAKNRFLHTVDSACVFANCSSRMSDGYRFGLGAEVGISTGRIHARGPVGVEGLLTTKWVMLGNGDTANDYASGERKFQHIPLPIEHL